MGTEQFDFQMDIQRRAIDEIDNKLVTLLIERLKHSQRIGEIKKEHNEPSMDVERRKEIMDRLRKLSDKGGLSSTLLEDIYESIFDCSILEQLLIINEK